MSDEIHNSRPPARLTDNWFVDGLKKQSAAVLFALLWAFYAFIWNSRDSGRDLKYQVDANTKAIEKLLQADSARGETQNQFLIALTKLSEAQNRLASDVRDIQQAQQKNTELLLNRK